jgi:fibrillarin-like rRNA methylase
MKDVKTPQLPLKDKCRNCLFKKLNVKLKIITVTFCKRQKIYSEKLTKCTKKSPRIWKGFTQHETITIRMLLNELHLHAITIINGGG